MELKSDTLKKQIKAFRSIGENMIADMLEYKLKITLEREEYLKNKELWEKV